jgi:hypothetical protein
MKKLSAVLAAALALAACGQKEDPAQQYRDALPKSGAVEIGTPAGATAVSGVVAATSSTLGGADRAAQSEYAVTSYYLALSINGGTAWSLRLLQFITAYPATSCDDASCTWGPSVDDQGLNRWKLVVTKDADHFDYAFSGQKGSDTSAPWVDLIAGVAYPGADRDHGSGTFKVDFDAQDALDHGDLWVKKDYGNVTLSYDNTKSPVTVGATFLGAKNQDPDAGYFMNVVYSYERAASGGELQVAFERLDTNESLSLRTRWSPSGAGRGDAHYNDGGSVDYYATQCWDGAVNGYAESFDSVPDPDTGNESACSPFSSASYADIALP